MSPVEETIRELAREFLSGSLPHDSITVASLQRGCRRLLQRGERGLRPLCRRVFVWLSEEGKPTHHGLVNFLKADRELIKLLHRGRVRLKEGWSPEGRMLPIPGPPTSWAVPGLIDHRDLASFLRVDLHELDWFCDPRQFERRIANPRASRYRYIVHPKGDGVRLLEAPKARLKRMQRRVLDGILSRVPPHDAAHGFRAGRDIRTFAAPHVGRRVVLRFDLRECFPNVYRRRIVPMFRTMGYSPSVAFSLASLCTNSVPDSVWNRLSPSVPFDERYRLVKVYGRPHLPQGAPTSPALANLVLLRLDRRLSALAGAMGATYTRYADDLAFSGDDEFARQVRSARHRLAATVLEEGFRVNHRKTRIMFSGQRQHLAGLVVNERLAIPREHYDRLKAILTNCIRDGVRSQNREEHPAFRESLLGRIGFVSWIDPERGSRLRGLFDRIDWSD